MKRIYLYCILAITAILAASCTGKEMGNAGVADEGKGYISLELTTLVSTNPGSKASAAPADYNAKTLCVEIVNAAGRIVKSTNDFGNDPDFSENSVIALDPGTYKINVHSANWDGSDSGVDTPFYAGSTTVDVVGKVHSKAKVTCTLANVKVSINFEKSFRDSFTEAKVTMESAENGVTPRIVKMTAEDNLPLYFPAANLELMLNVQNKKGDTYAMSKEFTDVRPRDHYIINFKIADSGSLGGISVDINEDTNTYSFNVEIPRTSGIALEADNADAWSNFAYLKGAITGKTDSFNYDRLKLRWRKTTQQAWQEVASSSLSIDADDNLSYQLKDLSPETEYEFQFYYNDGDSEVETTPAQFTTGKQEQIYNSGFETWYMDGKIACPQEQGMKYWNSSNSGAATYIGSVTTQDTGDFHSGKSSARLETKYAVIKLAAASIFTGDFIGLIGTKGAKLDWGVPFTSRPTALKGYMKYSPKPINRGNLPSGTTAPAKNQNDECQIFCALTTELLHVANASADGYEMSTQIDWNNDPRIIAYGQQTWNSEIGSWTEFNIPLEYHNTSKKPTHMIIVCSSSKWGDYFYGGEGSLLQLEDFEFVYGTNPAIR